MNPFGRRIKLWAVNWEGPLTALEARAIGNESRAPEPELAVRAWGLDAIERPTVVNVEPIKPRTPEWYFNGASPDCPICGGYGLVNRFVDGGRKTVPCECFEEWRCQ